MVGTLARSSGVNMVAKNVSYAPMDEVEKLAKSIAFAITTAKVKTATPSRSQNKIQVRISWKDVDGKNHLGYFSMRSSSAVGMVKHHKARVTGSQWVSGSKFIEDVFRTHKWAEDLEQGIKVKNFNGSIGSRACLAALKDELNTLGAFKAVIPIMDQALQAIHDCAAEGKHTTAFEARKRKEAKAYIGRAIDFAIQHGLKDAEIHEVINEVFVKNVMES
jgi:hypothetical protein